MLSMLKYVKYVKYVKLIKLYRITLKCNYITKYINYFNQKVINSLYNAFSI